jgi:hypothetical protein
MIKGNSPDVISANIQMLKDNGYSHAKATRCAMCHANKKHSQHSKSVAKKVVKKNDSIVKVKG